MSSATTSRLFWGFVACFSIAHFLTATFFAISAMFSGGIEGDMPPSRPLVMITEMLACPLIWLPVLENASPAWGLLLFFLNSMLWGYGLATLFLHVREGRFSLRTLFIIMTLFGIALGTAVANTR